MAARSASRASRASTSASLLQPVRWVSWDTVWQAPAGLTKPKPVVRLTPLYDQARAAVRQFAGVTLHWVPRHRNQQADALARAALQLPGAVPAPLAVKRKP